MFRGALCCSFSHYSNRNVLPLTRRVARAASHSLPGHALSRDSFALLLGARSFCRFHVTRVDGTAMLIVASLLTPRRCAASFSGNPPQGGGQPEDEAKFAAAQTSSEAAIPAASESNLEMDYEFDPMSSMQHDVAVDTAKKSFERVLYELLPDDAPTSVVEKVRRYLQQHPIDILITQPRVLITHLENPETADEEKVSLSPVPLSEALEQAQLRSMNLVQMSARNDLAFCRIRTERNRIEKLIESEMQAVACSKPASTEHGRPQKPKKLIEHAFRDAVDAHFVGWKSRKICEDIQKGHPVRITIKEFQSAESAMQKLRAMCQAIQAHAEAKAIYHHVTSIVGNDREASVSLSPALPQKAVKHPAEKEWAHSLKRMEEACRKAGRFGTYIKDGRLKPRNVGMSSYRVDKYGRRVD